MRSEAVSGCNSDQQPQQTETIRAIPGPINKEPGPTQQLLIATGPDVKTDLTFVTAANRILIYDNRGRFTMTHFFSFILFIALLLLSWVQPSLAVGLLPEKTYFKVGYGPLDMNKQIQLEVQPEYTFVAHGPMVTKYGFRYSWICPDGASLVDNACYTKIDPQSGAGIRLVHPVGAQIAFGYDLSDNDSTDEQLIFVTNINEGNVISGSSLASVTDAISSDEIGRAHV